jgi:hypothetical protein
MYQKLFRHGVLCVALLLALAGPVAAQNQTGSSPTQPQLTCHRLYLPMASKLGSAGQSPVIAGGAPARTSSNPCTPPYVGGPIPIGAPTYAIKAGAASIIQSGDYAITANTGGAYRLVWTGSNSAQRFYGSIWATGTFTSFTPGCSDNSCSVGASGAISSPVSLNGGGQRIDFDTVPGSVNRVGLDFAVSAQPVYFDLFIDGARVPTSVFFTDSGGQLSNPGAIPFALNSN